MEKGPELIQEAVLQGCGRRIVPAEQSIERGRAQEPAGPCNSTKAKLPLRAPKQKCPQGESGMNTWMRTMHPENLAEIVADALDRCVPGSLGSRTLRAVTGIGCYLGQPLP
jgi:hypothetical protein